MIDVKTLVVNQLQENCYIVSDDTREAVIIDCGAYYDRERAAITNYIRDKKLTLRHCLCTHGHFDHVFGVDTILQEYGLQPEVHPADQQFVEHLDQQYLNLVGIPYPRPTVASAKTFAEGDEIGFGSHSLHVFHTPGHSPGSVVFYCEAEHLAFTGDTLFRMSIGRTDLDGGSWQQMQQSLRRLPSLLAPDTKLYPGHGPTSTMADEMRYNPYLA